jgi:hypothetical protein
MKKIDNALIKDLEALVRDAGLDPLPVEWIMISNDDLSNSLQGSIPVDIEFWEDGYMYFSQQENERDWTSHKVFGVLEVIYDYGDHAVGFIREDMPIGTQANVVLHAYAHADFMKNHHLKKNYKNVISSYVNSVNLYRKKLTEYENKYGLDFIECVEDLAESLSGITSNFKKDEIFPTNFSEVIKPIEKWDQKKEIFVIDDPDYPPKDEHDILYSLMSVPWVSEPIKEILSIFRHRKMYTYTIARTKVVDEGWASYWDNILYKKAVKHLGIQDFMLDNPYPKLPPLRYYKEGGTYAITLTDLMIWLSQVLNDPYYMGLSFWNSKSRKKDINIFKYAHSITNNELYEGFNLDDLIFTLNSVLPFTIDIEYVKDLEVFKDIEDFIKKYGLSRMYHGYIPKSGIRKKALVINLVERPLYEWELPGGREILEIGDNVGLILDNEITIASDPSIKVNEFSAMIQDLLKKVMNIDDVEINAEFIDSDN